MALPSSSLPYLSPDLHLLAADCRAELANYVSCLLTLVFLRRCNIWGRSLRRQDHIHSPWAQHRASVELAATTIVQIDTRKKTKQNKQNSPRLSGDSESEGKIDVLVTAGSISVC